MIRVARAEWRKVLRRGMVWGGIGIMVGFSLLAVTIRFLNAEEGAPPGPGEPQSRGPPIFSRAELETDKGAVLALGGFAGNLIGVVSLVLFAQSVGSEYGWGTLRVMLAREPRRLRFLSGKLLAMAAFVGMGITAAWAAQTAAAVAYAAGLGIDTTAWWTLEGWGESLATLLRVWFTAVVWGLMGSALSMAFRAAAPAIGVGIGYAVIAESLLTLAWDEGEKWLPGSLLSMFNNGVGDPVALPAAAALLAGYAVVFFVASAALFRARDVSA